MSKSMLVAAIRAIGILVAALGSLSARAETSAQALEEITSTADKLCGTVATSGHFDTAKVTGDVKAELSGLAKRLADLGITGTADITSTTYEGVLQQELTTALKDLRECKLTVFKTLQEKLLLNARSDKIQGRLIPARYPSPANECTREAGVVMSPDAVVMYYGTNTLITELFPFTVVRISGRDLFVINRDKDKNISVNLEILGDDGRNILKITDNLFNINPNNFFGMERPNRNSLVVYDQQRAKVISVDYLNESAIALTGTIKYAGSTVEISPEVMTINARGMKMSNSHSCFNRGAKAGIDIQ